MTKCLWAQVSIDHNCWMFCMLSTHPLDALGCSGMNLDRFGHSWMDFDGLGAIM